MDDNESIMNVSFIDGSSVPRMVNWMLLENRGQLPQISWPYVGTVAKPKFVAEDVKTDENYETIKPTALVDEKNTCTFEFATPTKRRQSIMQSLKKSTLKGLASPKSYRTNTPKAAAPSKLASKCTDRTPNPKSTKPVPQTPRIVRKGVKTRIQNIVKMVNEEMSDVSDIDDSSEDEHYKPSDSEESDEEFLPLKEVNANLPTKRISAKASLFNSPCKKKESTPKTPAQKRKPKMRTRNVDMNEILDEYFTNANPSGCVTSDHTLSRLEVPRLAPDALQSLLRGTRDAHAKEKEEMFDELCVLFPYWTTLLYEGFSVFLCGVGSKKSLLTAYQSEHLQTSDHLVINGFFPSLTLRSIVTNIFQEILELETYPHATGEQINYLKRHFNDDEVEPLFLVIHNLDGPMMRSQKMQHFISQLASCKHVHLIASLDHINAPLLLEGTRLSLCNPIWWDATTLSPYTEETSYENSLLVQQSGDLAFSSLIHVFKSLTPNAKGIFRILAKYQLERGKDSSYSGLSFGDLYKMCREAFLVSSNLTLRAQLTEFRDHKLIVTKKGYDGVENILVAMDSTTLQDFMSLEDT